MALDIMEQHAKSGEEFDLQVRRHFLPIPSGWFDFACKQDFFYRFTLDSIGKIAFGANFGLYLNLIDLRMCHFLFDRMFEGRIVDVFHKFRHCATNHQRSVPGPVLVCVFTIAIE